MATNLVEKTKESRVGRANQRYNPDTGSRMVAGCIVLNETKDKVVMILSSVHPDKWIFPKGGIELDEGDDYVVSAVRETWEEAGVEGKIVSKLPVVYDSRGSKAPTITGDFDPKKVIPKSEFHFYDMIAVELSIDWPEKEKRNRRWCTYTEAIHELTLAERPELIQALDSSCILKEDIEY